MVIGLELALLVSDPWKIYLSSDHPNGAVFTEYPRILSWLMSKKARMKTISLMPGSARKRFHLESIDRELTFSEIAIMTRAGPAKALGLKNKGHLAPGADADVALYPIDPRFVDPSIDYAKLLKGFSNASYVLKEGEIVVKDGFVVKPTQGRTFWVSAEVPNDQFSSMMTELGPRFTDYYTMKMDNYVVRNDYLRRPASVRTSVHGGNGE